MTPVPIPEPSFPLTITIVMVTYSDRTAYRVSDSSRPHAYVEDTDLRRAVRTALELAVPLPPDPMKEAIETLRQTVGALLVETDPESGCYIPSVRASAREVLRATKDVGCP